MKQETRLHKAWFNKQAGKRICKLIFWIIVLCCFWWTVYSVVPYYWSVKVQDYYDMIRQNIKKLNTYDNLMKNVLFNEIPTEWEKIKFDTSYIINKDTADITYEDGYMKIFNYNPMYQQKSLEISISWNIKLFTVDNLWTDKYGMYDLPEYEWIGSWPITWDQSCYLLRRWPRKWYLSERDFELLEEENPNNCIYLYVTPYYYRSIAYIKFLSNNDIDENWYIEFQERPILTTHF